MGYRDHHRRLFGNIDDPNFDPNSSGAISRVRRGERITTPHPMVQLAEAAGDGAKTGVKASVNGVSSVAVSTLTVGFVQYDGPLEVTDQDMANGYNTSFAIVKITGEVVVGIGTGAASKMGHIGRAAMALDMAGNAASVGRGATSIYNDGLNFQNGLETAGGLFGLGGNATGALSKASTCVG